MVDTLVSGASASRHVGSSPILGTKKREKIVFFSLFLRLAAPILTFPPNLPLAKEGYKPLLHNIIIPKGYGCSFVSIEQTAE